MDKIIVTLGGLLLMVLIYWFFFGKKDDVVKAKKKLKVIVSGGYRPEVIELEKGKETKIILERTDPNSCLEEFVLPDFKIKEFLPLNKEVEIILKPEERGVYGFHCGMNMYHGRIIVK